jgi:uncharacterized repeat protein (TIGR03803 family)
VRMPKILNSLSAVLVLLFVNLAWGAATEQMLYLFNAGEMPSSLVFDSAGNLYGTTYYGGAFGVGSVFELSPTANGWTRTTLYSFTDGSDGSRPGRFQSLVFDAVGNLYGSTTQWNGRAQGEVFQLVPNNGTWTLNAIKVFKAGAPQGALVFDTAGNLYGTVCCGGNAAFEMSPAANDAWTYRVLHVFKPSSSDGNTPTGALSFDSSGNLYGTTLSGGGLATCINCGTVFKFKPALGGKWSYKVIYRFKGGADGKIPRAGVVSDLSGNLYGTTTQGGNTGCGDDDGGCGTVFKLSPNTNGTYKETRPFVFTGSTTDGGLPWGGVILSHSGNLYGTTVDGGLYSAGTVFELSPQGTKWTETLLYSFNPSDDYGSPNTGVILDPSGNLYGVTAGGRSEAYEVTP